MANLLNASVFMIACNEEHNIARALESARRFREIIVLDSGSTDRTVEIAEGFSNTKVRHQAWLGFGAQKQAALEACSSDWLVSLDADEVLTVGYVDAVANIIEQGSADALMGPRRLLQWNKRPRSFRGDDLLIRCFRRDKGSYCPRRVHEGVEVEGVVKTTDALILHHEDLTLEQRFAKSEHYSSLRAQDKFDAGDRASLFHVVFIYPLKFLQSYLARGNFLGGVSGFNISRDDAYYAFMKYSTLRRLQKLHQD